MSDTKIKFGRVEDYIAQLEAEAKSPEFSKKQQDVAAKLDEVKDKPESKAAMQLLRVMGNIFQLAQFDDLAEPVITRGQLARIAQLADDGAYVGAGLDKEEFFKGTILALLSLARQIEKANEEIASLRNKLNN